MSNRADVATAVLVIAPMIIGYIIGLRAQPRDRWQPDRHTRSHWKQ